MDKKKTFDLNIDCSQIKNHADYKELWKNISRVEIKMVEKNEDCRHNVGETYIFENPYKRPAGVCDALLHVIDLYIWRAAFGFPSWNADNRKVFKIHCPDPKGTVWEIRKFDD
jgi:uncharacterized repeat protein (TIGR04076 family)